MLCKYCGVSLPLMRRVCDTCRKKYQKEYVTKNKNKMRETSREWMRARRWLNGAERMDDMGPEINEPIRKSINGCLKLYNRRSV